MPPKKFAPKQPKQRKKKTEAQRKEDAKRNRQASQATDEVSLAQKRQQRLFDDPRLFLTEGLGNMAQAEVLKQYNRVLAYNKQKEEADDGPTYSPGSPPVSPREGPTYSPGSPPSSPTPYKKIETSYPPGVLIKKKNPNKSERAHNRDVKRAQSLAKGYIPEPLPNVDMASYMDEMERKSAHNEVSSAKIGGLPSWGPHQNYNNLPTTPAHSSFTPDEYIDPTDGSSVGDYFYELQLAKQNEIQDKLGDYNDILQERTETQQVGIVGDFIEEGAVDVVKMTDEEKEEILAQRSELLKKKKQAKTAEEKDYYKRAIADLKAGDTQATRSKRKEAERQAITGASTTFTPQVPGIKKYPGPANIYNEMVVVSTEVGRRAMSDDEIRIRGGGTAGQTEVFTSGDAELNDEYQRYANRKSQKLSKLREMGGTIKGRTSAFDEVPDSEDSMTEEQLKARLERIPDYPSGQAGQMPKAGPGYALSVRGEMDFDPVISDPMNNTAPKPYNADYSTSMLTPTLTEYIEPRKKLGDKDYDPDKKDWGSKKVKKTFRYNTFASNQQARYYGLKG